MGQDCVLVELRSGPLHGAVVQAPVADHGWPAHVIGVPVPVLDAATETFSWSTGNYFRISLSRRDRRWRYGYARTLLGYPALTRDHDA